MSLPLLERDIFRGLSFPSCLVVKSLLTFLWSWWIWWRPSSYSSVAAKQLCLSAALNEREGNYTNCGLPFSFSAWEIPRLAITLGRTKIPPGIEALSVEDTRAKGLYWRRKCLVHLGCRLCVMSRKTTAKLAPPCSRGPQWTFKTYLVCKHKWIFTPVFPEEAAELWQSELYSLLARASSSNLSANFHLKDCYCQHRGKSQTEFPSNQG